VWGPVVESWRAERLGQLERPDRMLHEAHTGPLAALNYTHVGTVALDWRQKSRPTALEAGPVWIAGSLRSGLTQNEGK
jgi:hypothetical protein